MIVLCPVPSFCASLDSEEFLAPVPGIPSFDAAAAVQACAGLPQIHYTRHLLLPSLVFANLFAEPPPPSDET